VGIGAYSIVRYADDVGDQRINLGVLLWHPLDGFRYKVSSSIDRVQAINPRLTIKPIKQQLDLIKKRVAGASPGAKEVLQDLARTFRRGLVISDPYPARIASADETLERLYALLVSPIPEIHRASSQKQFEASLKRTIRASLQSGWPAGQVKDIGIRKIGGIPVNVGVRTIINATHAALWHSLSFQSEHRPDTQLRTAKATVLDILKAREIEAFKRDKQFVAVRGPRAKASEGFAEVVSCLEHAADEVFLADDEVVLLARVQRGLRATANGAARSR
jgi:hypothetical protein